MYSINGSQIRSQEVLIANHHQPHGANCGISGGARLCHKSKEVLAEVPAETNTKWFF